MKKIDKTDLMCIFISFHPLLDLLTAIMTRFEIGFISIGVVVRSIFVLIMLIYLFFFNNSKYKIKSIAYMVILLLFCMLYFLTKIELMTSLSFLFNEVIYLFKYLYFPILFVSLINFCDQYNVDKRRIVNAFLISLIMYAILLIYPFLTNTGFKSYAHKENHLGVIGWFYSANEVSAILTILFPLQFLYVDKRINIKLIIAFCLVLFASILIGTKVAFFGMLAVMLIILIYYIFNNKKYTWRNYLLVIIMLLVMILSSFNLPVISNIKEQINNYNEKEVKETVNKEQEQQKGKKETTPSKDNETATIILSSRNKLVERLYNMYKKRPLSEKLFGIGFSNREAINNIRIERNVEMDFFEVFFRYGIIGFLIYISLFIYMGYKILLNLIKSRLNLNIERLAFILATGLGFGIAFISGHVFGSPPVSIYLAFLCVFCLDIFKVKKVKHLNKDKVTFLALHLGAGGIERATVNTANALVEEKDVTIISFYKLSEEEYWDINPKVNIKYLHYGKPNRKEWAISLKGFNNESFFKNSYIAVKVLLKKYLFMIREIKRIKEGIVISTRVEFSLLLNYFGNDNVLKIAQEHTYHDNNKKYLRKMKYGYGNIDYIIALTGRLKEDYEVLFKDNNKIKVILIPNMLSTISRKVSKQVNKRIVCISRLHPGKRINEIIDIAHELKDSGWTFDIIGDGEERTALEKQIKDLKLDNIVNLLGALPNDEAINILSSASIYVTTTITEGFPITIVEAISVGLPVVAYEIPNGIDDIIEDGKEGYIIKNRNKDEYIEKLKYLMRDGKERKRMGKYAFNKSKLYTSEEISKKWFNFLNGTILK